MTVGDRRLAMIEASLMPAGQKAAIVEMMGFAEARWSVAMSADVERFRAGIRGWLAGE